MLFEEIVKVIGRRVDALAGCNSPLVHRIFVRMPQRDELDLEGN